MIELDQAGDVLGATAQFQKAIRVTHQMRSAVIRELKAEKVKFVVAPYEADAQLAWLQKTNQVTAVITEDSDLASYGCRKVGAPVTVASAVHARALAKRACPGGCGSRQHVRVTDQLRRPVGGGRQIFTKLDRYGNGVEVDLSPSRLQNAKGFGCFQDDMFLDMCILSGCDYVDSVPGIGLKTAQKWITKYRTAERVIRMMKSEKKWKEKMPKGYDLSVQRAQRTFKHHYIYDMRGVVQGVKPMNPFPPGLEAAECRGFLGDEIADKIVARRIAEGCLDPANYEETVQKEVPSAH